VVLQFEKAGDGDEDGGDGNVVLKDVSNNSKWVERFIDSVQSSIPIFN
jgi:hypothetical protein